MVEKSVQPIGDQMWIADGPTMSFYGFPYPTRTAIVRLDDGDLWVWSPVGVNDELAAEIEGLGNVRHLVSPNKIHHLFLGGWAERWPEAKIYASPGLQKKRADIDFVVDLDVTMRLGQAASFEPAFLTGTVTRAAKRKYPLGLSGIGRRWQSRTLLRSTMCDKHGGTQRFAGRRRQPVRSAGPRQKFMLEDD